MAQGRLKCRFCSVNFPTEVTERDGSKTSGFELLGAHIAAQHPQEAEKINDFVDYPEPEEANDYDTGDDLMPDEEISGEDIEPEEVVPFDPEY